MGRSLLQRPRSTPREQRHRTLIDVLIIALLDNGLNLLAVDQYSQPVIKGVVIVAAVIVSRRPLTGALVK